MKILSIIFAAGLVTFGCCGANAATIDTVNFDFGEYAKNNEYGASTLSFTESGITVTATAGFYDLKSREPRPIFAYLDHDRNANAGLGACKVLDRAAQCAPSSDDNVTFGEILTLAFDQEVTITDVTFKNGKHGDKFDSNFGLRIDGGNFQRTPLENISDAALVGTTFDFLNYDIRNKGDKTAQFYINNVGVAPVPLPAAAWLFMAGLLGLGAVARRKH